MLKLYDRIPSGNCHKVRLLLNLLNVEYESIIVDAMNKQHKSEEYLKMNPRGQFPVLLDGVNTIYDSHAILVYLAAKYANQSWYSQDPYEMGLIQEWLSFSSNEIANSLNIARLKYKFNADVDWDLAQKKSILVLKLVDQHLKTRDWLELDRPTIADLACYPYIALASEGKIDIQPFLNVYRWIQNVQNLPGYIGMDGMIQ
ncbi:MAG: glutathione S-transferase [Leptospira sp.]|nr:glutathione S-transferase [Leptospira sp.]NCS93428.1 glutathione S-transferase [Leptospira sp.]